MMLTVEEGNKHPPVVSAPKSSSKTDTATEMIFYSDTALKWPPDVHQPRTTCDPAAKHDNEVQKQAVKDSQSRDLFCSDDQLSKKSHSLFRKSDPEHTVTPDLHQMLVAQCRTARVLW